ncbi:hypothetical protein QLX08_003034 [Tetragonisca angustula]|uniref:Uncharacterized protein n=1 Tax=Tetragonisca angustula TaxID=166442 RepID=A0AAW1A8M6_9HYME
MVRSYLHHVATSKNTIVNANGNVLRASGKIAVKIGAKNWEKYRLPPKISARKATDQSKEARVIQILDSTDYDGNQLPVYRTTTTINSPLLSNQASRLQTERVFQQ